MLPAAPQFKMNCVGAKSLSPNPIPVLPLLHCTHTHTHRGRLSLLRSSPPPSTSSGIETLKITSHVETDSATHLERCFKAPVASQSPSMKGGQFGAHGAVTLEKSKLDLAQKQTSSSPEVNCYSLNSVGPTMESFNGPRRFLAVYFISAIASNCSYSLYHSQ